MLLEVSCALSELPVKTSIRAARYHGNKDVRVEDLPMPTLKPGTALVEIEWCGICGSDLHEYVAGPLGGPIPTDDRPHPLTGEWLPVVLGHEACGVIKSSNKGSRFKPGQRVVINPRLNCKQCVPCTTGHEHQCPQLGFLGYSGIGGGFSEVVPVGEESLYPIPGNVHFECAALVEPLAVAHHAIKATGVEDFSSKTVLVTGCGPVGVAVILGLKSFGAKRIIVSEPATARRQQTEDMVEAALDPTAEDIGRRCRELTDGRGIDVAFDCAGVQRGVQPALEALANDGIWMNVSIWEMPILLTFWPFMLKELKVMTSACYTDEDFREVVERLGQEKYPGYERMVTGRICLDDIVPKGFKALIENKDTHIKIFVTPKKSNLG
ncbi:hypothetical protein H2200_001494 [Cladophialophora chaetospira]|uniref:(R,R)-butanediol dehydrogenase n=1 Tax=Cladophialophora chaetospira TaxID=386627 RepID=A0AA38XKZ3_9EURO|nr:hypothetical protein H2200_001494 [Cladophialophora chaetospira]